MVLTGSFTVPGVTGGISGDRARSQEPWAAKRWDKMNGAEVNGENREFSSGQPRPGRLPRCQACGKGHRKGEGPVLRAYIKILSSGSQVAQLHRKADM